MERVRPPKYIQGTESISSSGQSYQIERVEGNLYVNGSNNTVTIDEVIGTVVVSGINNMINIRTQDPRARVSSSQSNYVVVDRMATVPNRQPQGYIARPLGPPIRPASSHSTNTSTNNYLFNYRYSDDMHRADRPRNSYFFEGATRWLQNFFGGSNQNQRRVAQYNYPPISINFNQPAAPTIQPSYRHSAGVLDEDYVVVKYGLTVPIAKTKLRPGQPDKNCAVCQDTIQMARDQSCHPDCFHWFHFGCLKPWLRDHDNCPVCKKRVEKLFRPLL